jgi:cyclophilin family peptidyl-prolyl cis-trans isomerase
LIASATLLPFASVADKGGDAVNVNPSICLPKITHKVYLDVEFAKSTLRSSKLVIGLFGDDMPRTVKNFLTLCSNRDDAPSYVGSTFYRALSGNSIQGGAIGNPSGKTGMSSFTNGTPFPPDNYTIRHTRKGLVSAVRSNTEGEIDSRFFVQTEDDAGWANGRYAAFGIVLDNNDGSKGMDLVRRISRVEVKTPQNSPKEPISIVG